MECAICMELLTNPVEDHHHSENTNVDAAILNVISGRAIHRNAFLQSKSLRALSSTVCGHLFHTRCLQNWMLSNRTCPNCRKDTPAAKIIQIARDEVHEETDHSNEQIFHPPDLNACLSDNIAELRDQHGTLIADYNTLKEEYLSDRDQIDYVDGQIEELQADIDTMRSECETLKEAHSVKGKRRIGKR